MLPVLSLKEDSEYIPSVPKNQATFIEQSLDSTAWLLIQAAYGSLFDFPLSVRISLLNDLISTVIFFFILQISNMAQKHRFYQIKEKTYKKDSAGLKKLLDI